MQIYTACMHNPEKSSANSIRATNIHTKMSEMEEKRESTEHSSTYTNANNVNNDNSNLHTH